MRLGSERNSDPTTGLTTARAGGLMRLAPAALALALVCVLALPVSEAPGVPADSKVRSKTRQLDQVTQAQGTILEQIQAQNREVNALIGKASALRRREESVQAVLDERQAVLDEANAEYRSERDRLRRIRARLERAVAALEDLLISVYKEGQPDAISIIVSATSWSDLIARGNYLRSVQDADEAVVDRVQRLEVQIRRIVARLKVVRLRAKRARDEVARRRAELARARARLDAQKAELDAAQAERRQTLASLQGRQRALEDDLGQVGAPLPGQRARLLGNGDAIAPAGAPLAVRGAIAAANRINRLPYVWGGGHGSFSDSGYDCSGAVSYALHGGGLLSSPLDSTGLMFWGAPGAGNWITVLANSGHVYAVIAGLRWDTSGTGGNGPRWSTAMRSSAGFVPRHPRGL